MIIVAQTLPLPNLRKIFVPDKHYMIVDVDLSGADAQVVAWEANDLDLMEAFRKGVKIHAKNSRDVYPEIAGHMTDEELKKHDRPGGIYYNCKRRVHATNYGGKPPTLASVLKTSVAEEVRFQNRWFELHPGIRDWQLRVEHDLFTSRTVYNKFGYRRVYFDRVEGLLGQALAWTPQSTVALVCDLGLEIVVDKYAWVQLLLQNHDSGVFQIPIHREGMLEQIHKDLHIEVPYPSPLIIPWGMATSRESWGHCG